MSDLQLPSPVLGRIPADTALNVEKDIVSIRSRYRKWSTFTSLSTSGAPSSLSSTAIFAIMWSLLGLFVALKIGGVLGLPQAEPASANAASLPVVDLGYARYQAIYNVCSLPFTLSHFRLGLIVR